MGAVLVALLVVVWTLSPVDQSVALGVLPRGTGGRKIIALLAREISKTYTTAR